MKRRSKQQVEALAVEAAAMHGAEMSPEAIASELNISQPYLYKLLNSQGIDLSQTSRRSFVDSLDEEVKAEIIRVYQSKELPMSVVLARYEMSYNQMYTLLKHEGVDIRRVIDDGRETKALRMETAIKMYKDGARLWLIFDETGIYQPELHRELHRRDIELRRGPAKSERTRRKKTGVGRLDAVTDDPLP